MIRKQKLNWVTILSAADFEFLEVINYNVKITASGDSVFSDAGHAKTDSFYNNSSRD